MRAKIYSRVSTDDQTCESQEHKCVEYCAANNIEVVERIREHVSGKKMPEKKFRASELNRVLCDLEDGAIDAIIVYRLDRLTRSTSTQLALVERINRTKGALISVSQQIDTRGIAGRLVLTILAAVAESEREVIAERVSVGLQAIKAKGIKLGHPSKFTDTDRLAMHKLRARGKSSAQIAEIYGVSSSTIHRHLHWND